MQQLLSLEVDGLTRHALVHVPPAGGGGAPLPVVIVLHGMGGSAGWTLEETRWDETADREGFLVVAPEGLRPDLEEPPGFLRNPQVWNDGVSQQQLDMAPSDDVGFVAALLDLLPTRIPVDAGRVYATGFSNGAAMAFRLGLELAGRLAALAPVAGHCWLADPHVSPARSTLYIVGTEDPLLPLQGGEVRTPWGGPPQRRPAIRQTVARWARALGCPQAPATLRREEGCAVETFGPGRDDAELVVTYVEGLGHHWPGGRGQLSRRLFGPVARQVFANDRIWHFFRQHTRSGHG